MLLGAGMAGLVPENEIPLDHRGEPLVGGIFAVAKPPTLVDGKLKRRQRLIFDRRRQNATEARVSWISLMNGFQLRRKVLKIGEVWRGSGEYLSIFYFHLRRHTRGSHAARWGAQCPRT